MPGWSIVRGDGRVERGGELHFAAAAPIWRAMCAATAWADRELDLDLSRATGIDGAIRELV